jgi:hypothetical protein
MKNSTKASAGRKKKVKTQRVVHLCDSSVVAAKLRKLVSIPETLPSSSVSLLSALPLGDTGVVLRILLIGYVAR